MLIFGSFYLSKNPEKNYSTVLYINNNNNYKGLLSSKSAYQNYFWRIMWQDWSNDAENSALITALNCILQYIQIESSFT